jgi:hypothetical protein
MSGSSYLQDACADPESQSQRTTPSCDAEGSYSTEIQQRQWPRTTPTSRGDGGRRRPPRQNFALKAYRSPLQVVVNTALLVTAGRQDGRERATRTARIS